MTRAFDAAAVADEGDATRRPASRRETPARRLPADAVPGAGTAPEDLPWHPRPDPPGSDAPLPTFKTFRAAPPTGRRRGATAHTSRPSGFDT
jgi:hypothetical protein